MAFRQGVYIGARNAQYSVYECEDKGFYRLDICKQGTEYHTDPEGILYSLYRTKGMTYVFGLRELYSEYQELQTSLLSRRGETSTSSDFVNGEFRMVNTVALEDNTFVRTELVDGIVDSVTYQDGERVLYLQRVEYDVGSAVAPLTIAEYSKRELVGEQETGDLPYVPLNVLEMRFDIAHLKDHNWHVVDDVNHAREILKRIREVGDAGEDIGVDTETTGTEVHLYGKDELVGFVVAMSADESYYFPFRHEKFENLPEEFFHELMTVLIEYVDVSIAQNKKFDRQVIMKRGYDYRIRRDTFVLSMLVNPNVKVKGAHSQKHLTFEMNGKKYLELEDIFPNRSAINFAILPKDIVKVYACPDPANLPDLWKWQFEKLPPDEEFLLNVEMELADLKADQEFWGFRINYQTFKEGLANCDYCKDLLEKIVFRMTRTEFKITSGDALGDLLYNRMRCKVYARTKTQKASTGTLALAKLSKVKADAPTQTFTQDIMDLQGNVILKAKDLNNAKYPVVLVIQKYKEYIKLKTAFYNRVETQMKQYYDSSEGAASACYRYFAWINQNGAESGRQSSPMHQLPPIIKGDICGDSEDHYILDTDYNSMELRILPSLAREKSLIEREKNPDTDIHRAIGSVLTGKGEWEISGDERSSGKRRNFGVVYMISPMGLAIQNKGASPSAEHVKEAGDSIEDFYRGFPRIAQFLRDNKTKVLRDGYMKTFFNRYRYFPEIFDPDIDSSRKASLIRQANNLPVQGTGADITKMAEVNFDRICRMKGYNKLVETKQGHFPYCRLMLSIHDELLSSHHISQPFEEAMKMARDSMEIPIKMHDENGNPLEFAPLYAESSLAVTWGEGHGDHYKIPRKFRDELIAEWEKTGKSAVQAATPKELRDEVKKLVNKFHERELKEYMGGLVNECGLNAEAIASKVRHPKLTFSLLDSFGATEEYVKQHGKIPHVEHILYAVTNYIEHLKSGETEMPTFNSKKEKDEDNAIRNDLAVVLGEADLGSPFDQDGNVLDALDSSDDDYEEGYGFLYSDEEGHIDYTTTGEVQYIWSMFDAYVIVGERLLPPEADEVLRMVYEQRNAEGFYKVMLYYGGRMLDTGIRVEEFDTSEIWNYVKTKSEEKGVATHAY